MHRHLSDDVDDLRSYKYKRRAGQVVPWSQRALIQMLEQDGLLVSTDSDGRHKAVVRVVNGQRVRWWHVPVDLVPRS